MVGRIEDPEAALEVLLGAVSELSFAQHLEDVQRIVRERARQLLRSDGATFILRDVDTCFYADENAISPLWKGQRFPLEHCISGWSMINRRAAAIEDIYVDPRIPHQAYRPTFVRSLVMVPVRRQDPIAAIGFYWSEHHRATEQEISLAQALADSVAVALGHVLVLKELAQTVEMSGTDALTQIANRRTWDRALGQVLGSGRDVCLAMIDLDHFKRFNDQHGHQAGDELLRESARSWTAHLRETDVLARYGGEEFGLLLDDTMLHEAEGIAERLRCATPGGATVSIGVAAWDGFEAISDLVGRADAALYEAKQQGRDRVVVAGP